MEHDKRIRIGVKVKDRMSGFAGIITSRLEQQTGMVQFAVTPGWDGKADGLPGGAYIDPNVLEYMTEGIVDAVVAPAPSLFTLGDELQNQVTGVKGIFVEGVTFISGCRYCAALSRTLNQHGEPIRSFGPQSWFKRIGAGLNATKAPPSPGPKEPGGPSRRADSQRV